MEPVTSKEAEHIIKSELPNLKNAAVRSLIEQSYVQLKKGEQYLSIGRIMTNIRHCHKSDPNEAVEIAQPEAQS